MLDKLRDRIAAYLSAHRVCILSTAGPEGARAMPVRYHSVGLEIDCLLPRWADVAYHLEQDPRVVLVVRDDSASPLRWLRCLGTAQPVTQPDWETLLPAGTHTSTPNELYLIVRITPQRIDLLDESRGWGARETLDL